ncbi:MAG: peptidoglycan recognition family protein [Chthonomonadales bacterium]
MGNWKGVIKKIWTPAEFVLYCKGMTLGFHPQFVVLHNTSEPSLAQWPSTPWDKRVDNLVDYYKGQGWSAGPHLFIAPEGIIGFTPLTVTGVHSPSWNGISWGVEMVGEYMTESCADGPGLKVYQNAVSAVASLCILGNLDSSSIRFHREDPKTSHRECPGDHIVKTRFISDVHVEIGRLRLKV